MDLGEEGVIVGPDLLRDAECFRAWECDCCSSAYKGSETVVFLLSLPR